ncbi:zinc-ribbon domain-containing protein [Streptomyces sanglieri]|uniref:zinc-ribbon domain-containing protein n=1 Tax=Streptomyces sanglieri TaxID=193460 RepID=UPI003523267C
MLTAKSTRRESPRHAGSVSVLQYGPANQDQPRGSPVSVIRPRRPAPGRSLQEQAPQLTVEWHPTRNGSLSPADVSAGSSVHAWWLCSRCGFEWSARVSSRTRPGGANCQPCGYRSASRKKSAPLLGISLAEKYPRIASQWDQEQNAPVTPDCVGPGSSQRYWWLCSCGKSWRARPSDRTRDDRLTLSACPDCSRRATARRNAQPDPKQSLAAVNPILAAEWHSERNGELQPHDISPGSNHTAWWKGSCGHEWQTRVSHRAEGRGCPYCAGRRVGYGNDLATREPEIAARWHPTLNGSVTPCQVTFASGRHAWWLCPKCDHAWKARIGSQRDGRGCPICGRVTANRSARIPRQGVLLVESHPHLAAEWHPTLNGRNLLSETATNSGRAVWWPGSCGHAWDRPVGARVRSNEGCPYCSGHRVGYGNDLETLHPRIAAEWHPERNGGLSPKDVVPGSQRKVWWRASCGHQWCTSVSVRSRGSGCPACSTTSESRQQTDLELALLTFIPGLAMHHRAVATDDRLWRCDMVWPGRRLIVEYDGSYWHRGKEERDSRKATLLRKAGWTVVRVREQPLKALHPHDLAIPPVHIAGVIPTAEQIAHHFSAILLPNIRRPTPETVVQASNVVRDHGSWFHAWRNRGTRQKR